MAFEKHEFILIESNKLIVLKDICITLCSRILFICNLMGMNL